MTDWGKLVSGEELIAAANERKAEVNKMTKVKPEEISKYESQGWTVLKTEKSGKATMTKPKRFPDVFENEVWSIFYKMGFKRMNATNKFAAILGGYSKQVDVVAMDDETCIFVECKATETFEKNCNFKKELESIHGYYGDLCNEFRKQYGNKLKFKFIFATKNYLITDESADMSRIKEFNLFYFDYDTVQYFEKLVDHLGSAARYQLLGNLFQKTTIKEMENRVPAIEGKMGGLTYYTFLIEPEKLLKMSYVLHRNKANHLLMPTYQRLIKKDRLKAIREFVNEGGYFPNSIIVSIDKKASEVRFDRNAQSYDSISRTGTLYLPQEYHSIYVIDGQHRLYGYSDSKYGMNNVIPVVAFIDLPSARQVEMFMEINENQKKVSKTLRNTLNIDLLWESKVPKERKEALMLKAAEMLGEDARSPLYGRILTGEDTGNDRRCITTEYIKDALKQSKFLNEYDKNGIKTVGTLDKNNNDETLDVLFKFLSKCFDLFMNFASDEWEKGAKGCLTTNNTAYALVRIFDDIVSLQLKAKGQSICKDIDELYSDCEPMLLELCEIFNDLSDETRMRLSAYGGQAKKNAWRALQVCLNQKDPAFIDEELQEYIEVNCTDNNPESSGYVEAIESKIKDEFYKYFETVPNWYIEKVPESLGKTIAEKMARENYTRDKNGLPNLTEWDFISFDEIGKIATHSNNWTTFAQDILKRPSQKSSQSNTITWLKDITVFKKKVKDGKSLTRNEFSELEAIYKDFFGGQDDTDN